MQCLTFKCIALHAIVYSKESCKRLPCRIHPVFTSAQDVSHFSSPKHDLLAEQEPNQAASRTQYWKIEGGKIRTNGHCAHAQRPVTAAKEGPTFFSDPWEFYHWSWWKKVRPGVVFLRATHVIFKMDRLFSVVKRVPKDSEKMLTAYSLTMMVFLYFRKILEKNCLILILWHKYEKKSVQARFWFELCCYKLKPTLLSSLEVNPELHCCTEKTWSCLFLYFLVQN